MSAPLSSLLEGKASFGVYSRFVCLLIYDSTDQSRSKFRLLKKEVASMNASRSIMLKKKTYFFTRKGNKISSESTIYCARRHVALSKLFVRYGRQEFTFCVECDGRGDRDVADIKICCEMD